MITYTITGKTRKHNKFESFVESVIDYLLPYPYKREIHIDIEFANQLDGNYGECMGDRNFVEIEISKKDINNNFLDPRTIALTAAHELVHAKQYIKGQINGNKWNVKAFKGATRAPWEAEAYKLEEELVRMFYD